MYELRDFYYLNEKIVKGFLSQIEGGLIEEIGQSYDSSSPSSNFEVETSELQTILANAFGFPIPKSKLSRKSKESKITISSSKKSTIEFELDKLMQYLEPFTNNLEELNIDRWNELSNDEFILFEGDVKLPKGYKEVQTLKGVETFQKLDDIFGSGKSFQGEKFEKMKEFSDLSSKSENTKVYLTPLNSPNKQNYYFFGELIHKYSEYEDLTPFSDGTYKVFGRVEKILGPNEKITLYDITHSGILENMNRDQKRKMKDNIDVASKPSIKIKPIAIYK